jgi:hypothetical protein
MYGSRKVFVKHESTYHLHDSELYLSTSSCRFCGDLIAPGKSSYMAHAGQHMDEIAFAVVTKPYKDWEFYTDSSSSRSSSDLDAYFGVPTGDAEHSTWQRQRQDHPFLSFSSPRLPANIQSQVGRGTRAPRMEPRTPHPA